MPAKIRRVDFSPDEWIAGTLGMSLEEEAIYLRLVVRIYSHGGALPADPSELARLCGVRPQTMRRILPKLMPKFLETGGKLTSNRCETEIKLAQNRIESARINGAKGGRANKLAKAAGFLSAKANHHYHQGKEEGFSPKELNPSFLTEPRGSPPLPSRGDGGAPLRSTTKDAQVNSDDLITPEEKAAALAELHRRFDAEDKRRAASLNGHAEAAE
jgi:uncharacterized protein YdaU (DUF1376 family)